MKKIIIPIIAVAAFATALVSCQKQELVVPDTQQEVTLTFSSEKPAFDDETKTEWNGETIQWSAEDKISIAYTVAGNWQSNTGDAAGNAKIYQSNPIDEATSVAHFNVPTYFTGTTEGTHIFYAVYPALGNNNLPNAPVANISISPYQNPKADSFDSSADVMIGETGEYNARPAANETISLMWNRLVAHAVLTLNNINGFTEGEVIDYITLTAQSGANLVGLQDVNLITREYEKNEGNTSSNVLKVSAKNLIVNNGTVTFWACVLPETLTSLTVEVETNKATYTREISGISKTFKQNARNILSIKMNEAVREEKVVDNNEVVDVLNRALTGVTGTSYAEWSAKTSVSDAVYAGQSAGGNESIQLRSSNSNSGIVTTTSGGFAKKVVVTWNSNTSNGRTLDVYGSNTAYTNPTELYNTNQGTKLGSIVCGTSTELVIDGEYEFIGLRSNSGAMYVEEIRITWSTAGVEPDTTPKIVVSGDTTKDVVFGGETVTFNYELKNLEAEELTWEVSNPDMISSVSAEDGVLTVNVAENDGEERTATITLSCGDADDVILTVTQKGKVIVDSNFESGQYWIMGTEDDITRVMTPLGATVTYGYGQSEVVTDNRSFAKNAFTFTAVTGGYTIQDASGRYYYADATHKSFQLGTDSSADGLVWTVGVQNDGSYVLTNVASARTMKYGDGTYTTFGVYTETEEETGVYPTLVKADNPLPVELASISVSGQKTSFTVGDAFEFGGTVTATYNDGSTKTVTPTSVSTPDMTEGKHDVTVTYVESDVSKSVGYTITVNAAGGDEAQPITISKTIADIADANQWVNSTKYATITLDDAITVTVTGGGNTGKYYTSGKDWRIYQSENPSLSISAVVDYTIKTVKITYSVSNGGVLTYNKNNISSGTEVDVNLSSITFGVGNTGEATNGQVRVTAIEVVYQEN